MSSSATNELDGKVLVSLEECIEAHSREGVVFLDGSWFLKGRNAREEYEAGPRIEGAHFFDIDDVASKGELNPKGLPHMMPPKTLFAKVMDAMGVSNTDHLVVYASQGCLFPHRAWYQLIAMGHQPDLVHYMQGSLEDWKVAGGPIEEGLKKAMSTEELTVQSESSYAATDAINILDMQDILQVIEKQESSNTILVDVRARERFLGQVEEPRPNMRLGHMPGALNIPFTDLLDPGNVVKFKSKDEMMRVFDKAGLDIATPKRIVSSCGSGATACALVLALTACGRELSGTYLYDGSWSEWGGEPDTPIVK